MKAEKCAERNRRGFTFNLRQALLSTRSFHIQKDNSCLPRMMWKIVPVKDVVKEEKLVFPFLKQLR